VLHRSVRQTIRPARVRRREAMRADNSSALVRAMDEILGADSHAFARTPCRGSCDLAGGIRITAGPAHHPAARGRPLITPAISMTALRHGCRPHDTALPFHEPLVGLRLTRFSGAASSVRSNIPVTSTSARGEPPSDGGVPERGPTQPITPYNAINYSVEVSLKEYRTPVHSDCR